VLEEPGVLDGDRDVRAELTQDRFVHVGELARRLAEQVERANHPALAPQRHDELGPRPGNDVDVARIGLDVVHEDRMAGRDRGADQALAHFHAQRARHFGWIADRVRDREFVALGIEQVDRKCLKVRQLLDELRDLLQQLFEVEDGRHLAPERKERRQRLDGAGADIRFRCGRWLGHVWPKDVCQYNRLFTWT
jgi:hypothetical protein